MSVSRFEIVETALVWVFLFVIVVVLSLLIWKITRYLIDRDTRILDANAGQSQGIPFSAMFVLIILGGTVFVGLLAWIFQPDQESSSNGFGTLAGLILLGMVVFIGIMNILTLSAARIGMLDGRQPFGLPEGSVRAILTIAFIVLVGVLSSFLLTGSNNRTGYSAKGVVLEIVKDRASADLRASAIMNTYGANALVAIEEAEEQKQRASDPTVQKQKVVPKPNQPAPAPEQPPEADDVEAIPVFKIVIYPKVDYSVADDISKQTLTMVSTILAAMIGFYFATRSDAGAADPASVVRTNALKALRELMKEIKPEDLVAAIKAKLADYAKLVQKMPESDAELQKAAAEEIRTWEAKLAGYETKLEIAKTVGENDKASYLEIDNATKGVRTISNELQKLHKDIMDKHKTLGGV